MKDVLIFPIYSNFSQPKQSLMWMTECCEVDTHCNQSEQTGVFGSGGSLQTGMVVPLMVISVIEFPGEPAHPGTTGKTPGAHSREILSLAQLLMSSAIR